MNIWPRIRAFFADDRLDANLIAFYGVAVLVLIASLILRRLMKHGGSRLGRWTGLRWLNAVGDEAARQARRLLFWLTLVCLLAIAGGGVAYHYAGRDVRSDFNSWYATLTIDQLVRLGMILGELFALGLATELSVWMMRRLCPHLHHHAHGCVGCAGNKDSLSSWFAMVERYVVAMIRLSATWGAGEIIGLGHLAGPAVAFVVRFLTIFVVARLLTLACRALSHTAANLGDRLLGKGKLRHYWERISRLFPFGERCFEAAVWVSAASLTVHQLHSITLVADFGPRVVQCIGILFGTRVLIELLQVLLNEAFGLYDDEQSLSAKGRTLVPLMQSICQYVLYFGSCVVMLGVLGVDTRPILAGAGILGLGVGLGAQSLVTDVVSGFFILFENQYLVGDYVQIGDATGTVEGVSIRLTQVRDGHGKLFIIPNGQIKAVVNYSKGYINAVVDVRVPAGTDLESVFRAMAEAGLRLRQARKEVLAETHVQGLVELGTSEMVVRAVTKVEPGTHGAMQSEYRRLLKQVLDQERVRERPALAA
jgi:moderate conductance mechanosensitive channel